MGRKYRFALLANIIIIFTFLYSQILWASGYPVVESINSLEIQKPNNFLPSDLQENLSKNSCRIEVKPTDFYNFDSFLALLDPYKPLQNHTRLGLNNELGDVAYEKIKVSAKQGTGIFSSKSTVVTEYRYGYDKYGQHEKIWENEIYRKVSSNPIGTIVKAIVSIIIIAATWGMATPIVAAWMALSNFVFALLSGASFKDALIGAAISFAAAVIGAQLGSLFGGGASAATSTATGFAGFLKEGGMTMFFQALSLADSLMVDDQGRGLFEQMFGKWGSVVFDVISVLVALKSGTGNKGPPYQLYAAMGRLAVSAILTALGDKIDPRLRQFISAFTTSFLNAWANAKTAAYNEEQKAKFEQSMRDQGFTKLSNGKYVKWSDDATILTTIDPKTGISYTDVFNENGYSHSEALIKTADGQTLTAVTDMFGNIQGILPSGATPQFDSNGNFIGSTNESVFGTRYYGTNGQEQAWIPEGYTPIQNEYGEITGSYRNFDYGVTEYRDTDGKFQYWTRQGKDGEIYIHDGNTVTNLRMDGTTDWTKQNTPFSTINYYDAAGQKIIAQLMTKLDENGFIQNKIYHDLATDEFTYYDRDGNNLGTYQARRDSEGNIYAYKTTDANGNQIIVDQNLSIRSSLTPDGTYTAYRRDDPSKVYYVLRPDSTYIIRGDKTIRGVLDLDPNTGKYSLYSDIGTKITDNPVELVLTLEKDTIDTLPIELRNDIIAQQDLYIKSIIPEGAEGIVSAAYYDHNAIFIWTDGNETKFYDTSGKLLVQDYANNIAHPILMLANSNRLPGENAIVFERWTGVSGIEVSHDQYGNLTIKDEYTRYRYRNGEWEIDRKLSTGEWVRTYSDGTSKILNPIEIGGYDRLGNKIPTDEPWYLTVFGKIGSKNKSDVEDRLRFREDFEKGKLNLYYPPTPVFSDTPAIKSLDTRTFLIDPNNPLSGAKLLYTFPFVNTEAVYLEMVLRVMESSGEPSLPTLKEGVQLVQGKNIYDLSTPEINKIGTGVDVGFDMLNRLNAAFNVESVNADIQNYSYKISVFNINGRNTIMVYKDVGYKLPDTNSLSRYDLHSARPGEDPQPVLLSPPQAISVLKDAFPDLDINYEY